MMARLASTSPAQPAYQPPSPATLWNRWSRRRQRHHQNDFLSSYTSLTHSFPRHHSSFSPTALLLIIIIALTHFSGSPIHRPHSSNSSSLLTAADDKDDCPHFLHLILARAVQPMTSISDQTDAYCFPA
ncbi:hypothetical protein E2C01_041512 [Portunus trituberculatus]|uniref:Uncharacterized protein n=1 Tax=Portunus trituberculatus TaxID=210409 RepID=A0A5B7FQU1_PORTR|nr:hypothetical protein [Portunus trituberculatus]